ncbi:MAG: DNA polymerase III subunit [Verrucomicrobia bacterium]|jgi:DNA polymerase-3 subunit delta'|nr:DNA polymerase III subunit [Verrucomicrobiota bacterium]
MSFKDLNNEPQAELLQRSLERGRLGHAYLLEGEDMETLETAARTLAKTVNCLKPARAGAQKLPVDCCDTCLPCRHTDAETHPDVHWLRPESKLRVIRADQIRGLLEVIHLKSNEGGYKVAVLAGADRLNTQAANIFLKTLEEPPPRSVLLLLTTEPQRLLETIVSRCLRLRFGTGATPAIRAEDRAWLETFSQMAAAEANSLIGRYRLLGLLLKRLAEKKASLERDLEERSPLKHHEEVEKSLREKWESELSAAIESEYRHQRMGLLRLLQHWLRDLWLQTLQTDLELLHFRDLPGLRELSGRINAQQARENLTVLEQAQRLLLTNVQEALALEVCLLKLRL